MPNDNKWFFCSPEKALQRTNLLLWYYNTLKLICNISLNDFNVHGIVREIQRFSLKSPLSDSIIASVEL